ncbi:MAG TPA: helix-turn-helix domain-containing protein [Candidatus Binataceae bacterium]|nr:helix-turn-helix domain-containing protein [Candidatus Binataceae bacterium]
MAAGAIVEIGRAERNKRDKHERIIAAARELFRTRGFDQTTTSEIAELADVGKGTLFFHAGSKDELLVMVFQEDMGRTIERAFATVPNAPFLDQAMHVFNVMLKQDRRDLELTRIFVKELAFVKGDHHGIDAVTEMFFGRMSVLIEQAQRRGEIKPSVDPALLAYNLFALHFSFLVVWVGSGLREPDPAKPSLRQMLELQLAGLLESPAALPRRKTRQPTDRR